MSNKQKNSEKVHGDKAQHATHTHSYGAHTGTDGMQHMKPQSVAGAGNGTAEHKNALRQPPEFQGRSGKQHR